MQLSLPVSTIARLGKGSINAIQYAPDGTRFAVASSLGIWIYDTATFQESDLLTGHTDGVTNIAFSSDGRWLASGSRDGTVLLWKIADLR